MALEMIGNLNQKVLSAADSVVAGLTNRRTFGPVLHFRDRKPDGSWSVCISAGADDDCKVEILVKTPASIPQVPGSFKLEGGQNPKPFTLTNVTVDVPLQKQASSVTYSCQFGEQEPQVFTFQVPAVGEEPRILYFSCNDTPLVRTREAHPELYNAWSFIRNHWMASTEEGEPAATAAAAAQPALHLMIGGGDQIYADEIFLKVVLDDEFEKGANYGMILDFYIAEYVRRFGTADAHLAYALATVPSFMQADDHDFYNGYGSFTDARRPHPNIGKAAQITRLAFQIGASTEVKINGNRAVMENTSRVCRTGPKTVMLNLDFRSNRDVEDKILMEMSLFDAKLAEAERLCTDGSTHHLIVLFASPVIWSHSDFSDVYANVMKNVPVMSIFATDTLDTLRASNNIQQTTEMLHKLFAMAQKTKIRLLFVSGDVHNGAYGTLRAQGLKDNNDFRYAQQWVSSPIANLPDEAVGIDLMKERLCGPQKLKFSFDADPTTKDGDGAGGKLDAELEDVYTGVKNFLMIHGEGDNLVGQLYVNEADKSNKYLPIEKKWVSSPATITAVTGEEGGCCSVM